MVEQGTHKPLVSGPTPLATTDGTPDARGVLLFYASFVLAQVRKGFGVSRLQGSWVSRLQGFKVSEFQGFKVAGFRFDARAAGSCARHGARGDGSCPGLATPMFVSGLSVLSFCQKRLSSIRVFLLFGLGVDRDLFGRRAPLAAGVRSEAP